MAAVPVRQSAISAAARGFGSRAPRQRAGLRGIEGGVGTAKGARHSVGVSLGHNVDLPEPRSPSADPPRSPSLEGLSAGIDGSGATREDEGSENTPASGALPNSGLHIGTRLRPDAARTAAYGRHGSEARRRSAPRGGAYGGQNPAHRDRRLHDGLGAVRVEDLRGSGTRRRTRVAIASSNLATHKECLEGWA